MDKLPDTLSAAMEKVTLVVAESGEDVEDPKKKGKKGK